VAKVLDMPPRTADSVIFRFKTNGNQAIHDHRHDNDLHKGKHTKQIPKYKDYLAVWLHEDSGITLRNLRGYLNMEILRDILVELNIKLSDNERQEFMPLDVIKYLTIPEVNEQYRKREVKSETTISGWLDEMIYSVKHIVTEKKTANDPNIREQKA
jgi:hypothetical protein